MKTMQHVKSDFFKTKMGGECRVDSEIVTAGQALKDCNRLLIGSLSVQSLNGVLYLTDLDNNMGSSIISRISQQCPIFAFPRVGQIKSLMNLYQAMSSSVTFMVTGKVKLLDWSHPNKTKDRKTKEITINHKGTKMAKNGKDQHELHTTN